MRTTEVVVDLVTAKIFVEDWLKLLARIDTTSVVPRRGELILREILTHTRSRPSAMMSGEGWLSILSG